MTGAELDSCTADEDFSVADEETTTGVDEATAAEDEEKDDRLIVAIELGATTLLEEIAVEEVSTTLDELDELALDELELAFEELELEELELEELDLAGLDEELDDLDELDGV